VGRTKGCREDKGNPARAHCSRFGHGRRHGACFLRSRRWLHGSRSVAASSAIEKALTLNPNSAQAFGLGAAVYSVVGHFDRVVKYAQRSIQLSPFDPLHFVTLNALGRTHFLSSRYDEAIEAAQRALQFNPQFARAYVWLIGSLIHLKRAAQAVAARQRLLAIDPHFRFARWIGFTMAPSAHQRAITIPLQKAGVPE